MNEIRGRFAHVDSDPFTGPRIFFENAGGALTLKSVVETSATYAAIPDNQGRENAAAGALADVIAQAKSDIMTFFNAQDGQVFVGESGTELLFRLIRTACMGAGQGAVIGSTVEHPASRSAAQHWAKRAGLDYIAVPHLDAEGLVSAEGYADHMRSDVKVATILHTSPVTGMRNDIGAITDAIRAKSQEAFIIVDGIQHASHGHIDLLEADVDGYVISPYKVFSRHGYGVAWVSERLSRLPLEALIDGPAEHWELGTRDTGAYATMSDVVSYFEWLGSEADGSARAKIDLAGQVIQAHEAGLADAMLYGVSNLAGLAEFDGVTIIGGPENRAREGLVTFALESRPAAGLVADLNARGVRTHIRKADHYSGNILCPLGLSSAVRVSMCHYNTMEEVTAFLAAMKEIVEQS
ncbi:MAG: aminotransferase class V-fold PLP-dependent enzyme [Paracoccaceae bacterium]